MQGPPHDWLGRKPEPGVEMTQPSRLRTLWPYAVALVAGLALVIGVSLGTQPPANGASDQPLTDDTVVASLQTSKRAYPVAVQEALRATRQAPDNLASAQAAARILISEGRNAGDTRLVGAALGVLRPFMADPDAQTLYLAATARQYQHDFPGALALLDDAARRDPADVNVLLTRATVQIVLGRFDLASVDCDQLYALSRPDLGFLCQATNRLLTADAPKIYDQLTAILAQPGVLDPALHNWARGLQGEIAALQGDAKAAQAHLSAVVTADAFALRERLLLADLLLAEGQAQQAIDLLAPAIPADGVLIRRVLAAMATGDSAMADKDRAELAQRFKLNIDIGLTAHAREETLYFLRIAKDPDMALQRALVNWALQHEIEDAQLLVDAAIFANQPEAAVPVVRWMAEQSVVAPSFRMPDAVTEAAK